MDLSNNNKPHFHRTPSINNNTTTGSNSSNQLFICFTSRLSSSSSMKISKSIFSPAPHLRSNGSLKAGQASPLFSKKRGCGFENKEPSSPKVTCIGQVRVKTKKKAKQGSFGGGERFSNDCVDKGVIGNVGSHNVRANSSWVHFPLTICEALRVNSCFSTSEREKEEILNDEGEIEVLVGGDEERNENNVEMRSSRKHVLEDFKIDDEIFDGNGGSGEEGRMGICIPPKNALLLMRCRSDPMKIEGLTNRVWEAHPAQEEVEEEEIQVEREVLDFRRSIFGEVVKEIEGVVLKCEASKEVKEEEEQKEGEVCNCKGRIFGEEVVKEIEGDVHKCEVPEEVKEMVLEIENQDSIEVEEVLDLPMEVQDEKILILGEAECDEGEEEEGDLKQKAKLNQSEEGYLKRETESKMSGILMKEEELMFMEALEYYIKITESEETDQIVEKEEDGCRISSASFSSAINQVEEDGGTEEVEIESTSQKGSTFNTQPQLEYKTEDLGKTHENEEVEDQEMEASEPSIKKETENEEDFERRDQFMIDDNNENVENVSSLVSTSPKAFVLPDCLLLMMYEPKLSMEVSKETWVCNRDFSRWLPQRHKLVKQPLLASVAKRDDNTNTNSDEATKRISTEYKKYQLPYQTKHGEVAVAPPLDPLTKLVPPRSSCSYPVAKVSMATLIEQKLVNAVGYAPFSLTRCKSEPMRNAGKLATVQDSFFWTKRELEPPHQADFHIGAMRVGF